MHSSGDQAWSQAEQQMDSMVDFGNFIDIDDIDSSSFNVFDQSDANGTQHGHQPPNTPFSADMQGLQPGISAHDFAPEQFGSPSAMDQSRGMQSNDMSNSETQDLNSIMESSAWPEQSPHQQTNVQNQTFMQQQCVPPTPNSYELQGSSGHYQQQMDPQTRAFSEQQYRQREEAMAFTPSGTPAVTPQDSHFHQILPEYTIPGAYSSPLTSPALQAQSAIQHQHAQGYYTNPSTAANSTAASPTDPNPDVEMSGEPLSLNEATRKQPRRKAQQPRSTGPTARVRQSPIVKPSQKRKSILSSVIPPKELDALLRNSQQSGPLSAGVVSNYSSEHSATDSVSPEPLSESLMGPPPKPRSAKPSPVIAGQHHSAPPSANPNAAAPATPASLMSIKKGQQQQYNHNSSSGPHSAHPLAQTHGERSFEDFSLPPAVDLPDAQPFTQSEVSPSIAADLTPRSNARGTSSTCPQGTPASFSIAGQPQSATSSPSLTGLRSPAIAGTPTFGGRKPDGKVANGKKRGSVQLSGSALVSPAIRPKVSPSIKPLLPEGASLTDSQHALLLASKSNYTHLSEGTLLPGVSYPDSLSSGLTSKRTSHKIAEQGRRNRINGALKEMQASLPVASKSKTNVKNGDKSAVDDEDEREASKNGGEGKGANSKAATVESAIEYIRLSQKERENAAAVMREKDAEVEALRKRLEAAETRSSSPIITADAMDVHTSKTEESA